MELLVPQGQTQTNTHKLYLEASCNVAMVIICGWRPFPSSRGDTRGVSDISGDARSSGSSENTHLGDLSHRGCCLGLRCLGHSSSEPSSSSCVERNRDYSLFMIKKKLKKVKRVKAERSNSSGFYYTS